MSERRDVVAADLTREPPARVSDRGAIGTRLASARTAQGLTVEQVAHSLLLSKTQVQGLEEGRARTFYNEQFYQQGLRKYAALVQVPYDAPAPAHPSEPLRDHQMAIAVPRVEAGGRGHLVAIAFAVVALTATGWAIWVFAGPARPATARAALPASALPFNAEPSANFAESAAAASPVATSSASPYGRLEPGTNTWVFVRYSSGEVVEKGLAKGERFVIEALPEYLAVGAPDVRLTVRDRDVDITRWIVNGQLRIGSRDFALPQLAGN